MIADSWILTIYVYGTGVALIAVLGWGAWHRAQVEEREAHPLDMETPLVLGWSIPFWPVALAAYAVYLLWQALVQHLRRGVRARKQTRIEREEAEAAARLALVEMRAAAPEGSDDRRQLDAVLDGLGITSRDPHGFGRLWGPQ